MLQKAYVSFCSNQPAITSRLKEYKQSHAEFQGFLNDCLKKEECKKQDLASFLIQPMQRLCKYPLFFGQLEKYTPEDDDQSRFLKEGRMQVLSLVDEVNSKVNKISNLTALVEVNMRLENAEMWQPTVVRNHELLYETVEEINQQPMSLFVFTDMLLICKQVPIAQPSPNSRRAAPDSQPDSPPKRRQRKPKLRVDKLVSSRACQVQTGGPEEDHVVSLLVDGCDIVSITCTNRQRKRLLERKLKLCFGVVKAPEPVAETAEVDFVETPTKTRKRSQSSFRKSSRVQHDSSPAVIAPVLPAEGEHQRFSSDSGPRRGRQRNRVNSMPHSKLSAIREVVPRPAPQEEDEAILAEMGAAKLAELLVASHRRLADEKRERESAEARLRNLQDLYDLVKQDSQRFNKNDPPLDLAVENRRLRAQLGAAQSRIIALEEGS